MWAVILRDVCPVLYMESHGPGKGGAGYVCLEPSEGRIEGEGDQGAAPWEAGLHPMDYPVMTAGLEVIAESE